MDVSGLVITVLSVSFELASELYSYAQRVRGARRDIQALSNELFGLIGALEHFKLQQERKLEDLPASIKPPQYAEKDPSTDSIGQPANVSSILSQTLEFLNELQGTLSKPKGKVQAAVQLLKWPLKEGDMQKHLKRLERVKTYFILSLVTDEADQTRRIVDDIAALRSLIQDTSENQSLEQARLKHTYIADWLSTVDPSLIRHRISQARTPGTSSWFISSEDFRNWRDSVAPSSQVLWLSGISTSSLVQAQLTYYTLSSMCLRFVSAGAGKSFLTTAAINDLLSAEPGCEDLAYFYCSFSNEQSLHPGTIFGSLLAQICPTSDPVYQELVSMYEDLSKDKVGKPISLETHVLVDLLMKQAKSRGKLYIIVDGVNECSDPFELLDGLQRILDSTACIRVLLSSINEKGIESSLKEMPNLIEKSILPGDVEHDIGLLVQSTLESHRRLGQLSPDLKEDIASALSSGAQGMFRWVQCQLDLLSRLRTPGAVRKALTSLPPTLDKTYEEILGRIDGEEDRALTKQILEVLAFTLRPLTLSDVCEILQITPGMPRLDESKCLTQPTDILSICGSLLNHDKQPDIVTLAHHSVKSYLVSDLRANVAYFQLNEQEGHRSLALYCLTYLLFDGFSVDLKDPTYTAKSLYPKSKFLSYAVQNWALHVKGAEPPGEPLWNAMKSFLLSGEAGRHNFQNWVRLLIPGSKYAKDTPPLYYAASFGLTAVVQYLLDMGADLEVHGGRAGATPINIAAFRGNLETVKLLFERGADPLARDYDGINALEWARYRHNVGVVRFFEQKGYEPPRAGRRYGNITLDEST